MNPMGSRSDQPRVAVGDTVEIRRMKWPRLPHRAHSLELVAYDEHGHWFDVPPGVDTSSEPGWDFSQVHRAVLLVPASGWWTSYWSEHGSIYIDVTTPPTWTSPSSIETVDLALDVYVSPSGEASTLDVDEFRRESPGWPEPLARNARHALAEIRRSLDTRPVWRKGWEHLRDSC